MHYHGKKTQPRQKVGNIPYLCKHINRGRASPEPSLEAFPFGLGTLTQYKEWWSLLMWQRQEIWCKNMSLGRAKLAERVQHSRCLAHLLPRLTCVRRPYWFSEVFVHQHCWCYGRFLTAWPLCSGLSLNDISHPRNSFSVALWPLSFTEVASPSFHLS